MSLEKEIQNLKKQIQELKKLTEISTKRMAIIEQVDGIDTDGKMKYGKVRLRVAGVHPSSKSELPTNQLPWQSITMPLGSSGGVGSLPNLQIGQWVEVEAANPSATAWKVIGNVATIPTAENTDDSYGNVAEGDDNKLSKDLIPGIGTGDVTKLKETVFSLVNSELLKFTTDPNAGVTGGLIIDDYSTFDITTLPIDWTLKEVSRLGADLGTIVDFIKVNTAYPPLDMILIELVPEGENNSPGNIIGYDLDGNPQYPKYENNNLYIPPVVNPGNYTITYRVTQIDSDPLNFSENTIDIIVIDEPLEQTKSIRATPRVATGIPSITDPIIDHEIVEPESRADKAVYSKVKVEQSVDKSITIENDSTPGNRRYSITHMTDSDDRPEKASRFEMCHDGSILQKSAGDMIMISKGSLQQYIDKAVEYTIKNYFSVNAPSILLKGNIRIEGDMNITGNITHLGDVSQTGDQTSTGTITGQTDVIASGITMKGHVHTGHADSGDDTLGPSNP